MEIIAFGTHLSRFHGYTVDEITRQGFEVKYRIYSMLLHDDAGSISSAYALTALKFSDFWSQHQNDFDWVFCLGDRYEMAAAVASGIPLNIRFAHIHGGETTLGAIDNIYRHSISLASKLHFVALEEYKRRIKEIVGEEDNCFTIGSLSLDNLHDLKLLSIAAFKEKWNIDLDLPSVLVTVHPETVDYNSNFLFAKETLIALSEIVTEKQLIVTMPNADTSGSIFRNMFLELKEIYPDKIHLIENFGTQSYFTCMKYVDYLLGNTSSGIIEAASFNKFVINLGDRQKGRITGDNVIHVPFKANSIIEAVKFEFKNKQIKNNLYYKSGAAKEIIKVIKNNAE